MNKKICPVCDHLVGAMNYCKTCKTFVRRPIDRNVDYYLNEGHPRNETKCSYHKPERDIFREAPRLRRAASLSDGGGKPSAVKARMAGYLAVTAVVVTAAVTSVIRDMNRSAEKPGTGLPEFNFSDMTFDADDFENYERTAEAYGQLWHDIFTDLDESEVIKNGKGCSGISHFYVDGKKLAEEIEEALPSMGLDIQSVRQVSHNVERNGQTYFETTVLFTIKPYGDETEITPQFISIDYDTGSGQVHNFFALLNDWEHAKPAVNLFVKKTEEAYGITEEDSNADRILAAAEGLPQNDGFFYDTADIFEVSHGIYGGSFYIEIEKKE